MFGINTFLGTVLKTIINLIFADKTGLSLDVHSQVDQCFFFYTTLNKKSTIITPSHSHVCCCSYFSYSSRCTASTSSSSLSPTLSVLLSSWSVTIETSVEEMEQEVEEVGPTKRPHSQSCIPWLLRVQRRRFCLTAKMPKCNDEKLVERRVCEEALQTLRDQSSS